MIGLSAPIHVEQCGELQIRYFRSPTLAATGVPDMPWHVCDDLWHVLGIDEEGRKDFLRSLRSHWHDPMTIATDDGLLVIAPFVMGDVLATAWLETNGVDEDSPSDGDRARLRCRGAFRRGTTAALKAMTSHLSGRAKLVFALEAMENIEEPCEKETDF
ncbi:hypothetical protein G6L37_05045 [Agrobacterium rubi]|nr:hypothetical protein [Agrobacterium rubi]NTF24722.1 hypothetical protein [Agrobacterium rubi]